MDRISIFLYSTLLLLLRATADPGCTPAPLRIFWNIGGTGFVDLDVSQWLFVGGNATQCGSSCTQPNCTSWSAGLWPSISDDGQPVNGGVPQAANLTAHLEVVAAQLPGWLPDPNWAGNAVFDFEDYTPIWEQVRVTVLREMLTLFVFRHSLV